MLIVVLVVVLCAASLAAAVLQTMRLRTLQQRWMHSPKMWSMRFASRRHCGTTWSDLRNPAACMYSLAQLIQENRNGDPEQLNHFLDEMHKSSSKVLQVMADQVPPPPDMRVVFGDAHAPSETGDTIEQKKVIAYINNISPPLSWPTKAKWGGFMLLLDSREIVRFKVLFGQLNLRHQLVGDDLQHFFQFSQVIGAEALF